MQKLRIIFVDGLGPAGTKAQEVSRKDALRLLAERNAIIVRAIPGSPYLAAVIELKPGVNLTRRMHIRPGTSRPLMASEAAVAGLALSAAAALMDEAGLG